MGGDVSQCKVSPPRQKVRDLYLKGDVVSVTRVALHDSQFIMSLFNLFWVLVQPFSSSLKPLQLQFLFFLRPLNTSYWRPLTKVCTASGGPAVLRGRAVCLRGSYWGFPLCLKPSSLEPKLFGTCTISDLTFLTLCSSLISVFNRLIIWKSDDLLQYTSSSA